MMISDREMLVDVSCLEPVATHGLLGVVDLNGTFLMVFFRWRVKSEDGVLIRERVPHHAVELPRNAAEAGSIIDRWLGAQPKSDDVSTGLRH
jgi:hypothetical protein